MLQIQKLSKQYGTKEVLKDINLTVYDGEHIAIIGSNGQGKSTLANLIFGTEQPDFGQIVCKDKIGYLKQNSNTTKEELEELVKNKAAFAEFLKYASLLELDIKNLNEYSKLSGGEKTKIGLCLALCNDPQILILDEPTNHLDINGKQVLTNFINHSNLTILCISHDIDFINDTANKIWELKNGNIKEYYGNYDNYVEQTEIEKQGIEKEYQKQQKRLDELEKQIENYKNALKQSDNKKRSGAKRTNNTTTQDERSKSLSKFAASKISQLKQEMDKDIQKVEQQHKITYKLQKDIIKTKVAIMAKNLTKKVRGKTLFENANFTVCSGDKIGIVGSNGTGKTTLLNILLNKTDFEGQLFVTPSIKPAFMQQDIYDLDENETINSLSLKEDKNYRTSFITNLISMNIDKTRFDTKLKYLSSGERMRIKLTQIILSDANLIVLDEPTNHLDIENKNYLQQVLEGFEGTVLIVSHDKNFLEHTTNKTLKIENKQITCC